MKDETGDVAIICWIESKNVFILGEHKKAKGVIKNVVGIICHRECKDVLMNKKSLRHFINRIKVKIIEEEPMKSTKFLCHRLMIKSISYTMAVMDKLLIIRVSYEKSYFHNYSK